MSGKQVHGRGRLTPEDHEVIEQLAGEGKNANEIAGRIRKHPSTVQWFMYSNGLQAPKQRETPMTYMRGGRMVQRFTAHEDAFIQALRIQGYSPEAIAPIVSQRFSTKRSNHTVRCRLKMLASLEEMR